MNWFSWLSRTSLEPSLVYDYTLAFEQNELQEEDIAYLDHEFLQSIGISIAKHRLEILKLARKDKNNGSYPVSKLLFAINTTWKSIARYMRVLVGRQEHQNDDRALVVVKATATAAVGGPVVKSYSWRWKRAVLNRNRKLAVEKRLMQNQEEDGVRMLTDGIANGGETAEHDSLVVSVQRLHSFSGPLVVDAKNMKKLDDYGHDDDVYEYDHDDIDAGHWTPAVEEIRWDAMFQNLKPT